MTTPRRAANNTDLTANRVFFIDSQPTIVGRVRAILAERGQFAGLALWVLLAFLGGRARCGALGFVGDLGWAGAVGSCP